LTRAISFFSQVANITIPHWLVKLGEAHGVVRGVVVNALLDDLSAHDAQARLWPQTERLKANAKLAVTDARYWVAAIQAAEALISYLDPRAMGLWFDCMTVNRRYIEEPAPASNFYHIIAAVKELGSALKTSALLGPCSSSQVIPPEIQTEPYHATRRRACR
jgi:mannose/cellobiose epimerase-like protein (N-acyl-D-glucosamine 2-epimerase family)